MIECVKLWSKQNVEHQADLEYTRVIRVFSADKNVFKTSLGKVLD